MSNPFKKIFPKKCVWECYGADSNVIGSYINAYYQLMEKK